MYQIIRISLLISLSFLSSISFGQSLKTEIDNIYNFSPSKLSRSEQELKVPALDKFWNKIKSDTTSYLPGLRNELTVSNHNPYFYFDGSALLLSLSKSLADEQLAANAITKCDMKDISNEQYVRMLNHLANDGANVTTAAIKVLRDTSFRFFIPQHDMTFDQSLCLAYMLVPQNPKLYVDSLISYFKKGDTTAQKSILTTLWFAYTCKGDSLIKDVANDKLLNKSIRDIAKDMMAHTNLSKDESSYIKNTSENDLADLRKKSLQRFSDEAVDELALTTKVLRKEGNCR